MKEPLSPIISHRFCLNWIKVQDTFEMRVYGYLRDSPYASVACIASHDGRWWIGQSILKPFEAIYLGAKLEEAQSLLTEHTKTNLGSIRKILDSKPQPKIW